MDGGAKEKETKAKMGRGGILGYSDRKDDNGEGIRGQGGV